MATTTIHNRDVRLMRGVRRAILYAVVILLAAMFTFPYLWTISSSLKATHELYTYPPLMFPEKMIFDNYPEVFRLHPFGIWIWNTILVTTLSTVGATASAMLVAYAFARLRYPGKNILFMITLATMMLPSEVTLVPTFLIFYKLGWLDTLKTLWFPSWLGGGAFNIFLMRQFIQTLPRELDEAALIDGADYFKILTTILVPLMKPVIATVAVIHVVWKWSEFMGPLVFLNSTDKLTIALGLRFFDEWGKYVGQGLPQDNYLMAACVITTMPIIVLFFATQGLFVQGIAMTGIKG